MSGCTCVKSSLRACIASLLSSFSPLLSTASITWSRSGSQSTAVLPCCRSCRGHTQARTHTHTRAGRDAHANAQSCTPAVIHKFRRISEECEKSKKWGSQFNLNLVRNSVWVFAISSSCLVHLNNEWKANVKTCKPTTQNTLKMLLYALLPCAALWQPAPLCWIYTHYLFDTNTSTNSVFLHSLTFDIFLINYLLLLKTMPGR